MIKKQKIDKSDPNYIPKRVCFTCGLKYGKDKGIPMDALMDLKCDVCNEVHITMHGLRFSPYNFKEK